VRKKVPKQRGLGLLLNEPLKKNELTRATCSPLHETWETFRCSVSRCSLMISAILVSGEEEKKRRK
jgi:hypothetical protein